MAPDRFSAVNDSSAHTYIILNRDHAPTKCPLRPMPEELNYPNFDMGGTVSISISDRLLFAGRTYKLIARSPQNLYSESEIETQSVRAPPASKPRYSFRRASPALL